LKSVPLKRMASSQNFFVWFCGVLIFQRGLILRRTTSCGVSDPAELSLAGVSDPAEQWQSCAHFISDTCSARSDTPQNTFKYEYFCKFETEIKNILGCEFGDYMGSIRGKNRRSKISCYCPFKQPSSGKPSSINSKIPNCFLKQRLINQLF
jgi:hypothetical protein